MKNHEKRPFRTPVWGEKSHFGAAAFPWKFAKSIVKMRISCLWHLLGENPECHLLFHLRLYCSEHPPFQKFIICFENVLAALDGKHNSEGCINETIMKHVRFGPHLGRKISLWSYLLRMEICKIHCTNLHFLLMAPLG